MPPDAGARPGDFGGIAGWARVWSAGSGLGGPAVPGKADGVVFEGLSPRLCSADRVQVPAKVGRAGPAGTRAVGGAPEVVAGGFRARIRRSLHWAGTWPTACCRGCPCRGYPGLTRRRRRPPGTRATGGRRPPGRTHPRCPGPRRPARGPRPGRRRGSPPQTSQIREHTRPATSARRCPSRTRRPRRWPARWLRAAQPSRRSPGSPPRTRSRRRYGRHATVARRCPARTRRPCRARWQPARGRRPGSRPGPAARTTRWLAGSPAATGDYQCRARTRPRRHRAGPPPAAVRR